MKLFNISFFGWLASVCFSLCSVPQAWESFKNGHSNGISWGFLLLWLIGEICAIIYVLPRRDMPLLINYIVNAFFISVIIFYKL